MELTVDGHLCHVTTGDRPFDKTQENTSTVVLIHGAANDCDVWQKIARGLTGAGHTVLVPDLPGHGLSRGEPLRSIEALADWIIALLDAAGVKNAVLAGHSMGSLIALEAAARHPQRVSKLILLGSSTPMPVSDALLSTAQKNPDSACRMIMKFSHTPQFYLTGGGGHGVWGPGATLAIMRRSPPGVLALDLDNCNRYLHGLEAAANVTCPTLLVVARRDKMTPARNVQPLQAALRKVSCAEIPDCGHAMMNEQPERVTEALQRFLQESEITTKSHL
jgi:pimeloyl-ACP methyl ester carboxylesterase